MTDDLHEALRSHFGFDRFLPGQEQVVGHLLAGKSAAAVFPTGGGKSLCYQLPALIVARPDAGGLSSDCLDEGSDRWPVTSWYCRGPARFDAERRRVRRDDATGANRIDAIALRRPGTISK